MAFRQSESSFADLSVDKRLLKVNSFLKEIDSVIDFKLLRPILAKNGIGVKSCCGNKAYDSLIMFKILLLQKFYSFSDEAAERSLLTDNLTMRFVGLSIDDDVPDSSTIGRFRQSLIKHKLYDKLFDNVNKQLESKGLMFQSGRSIIVDATLVKSDNISITKASKDERNEKAKKVDEANERIDKEIQTELTKPKPSSKTISRLLKRKEHNSRTLKNSEIDEKQAIDSKELSTSQEIIKQDKDGYNHKDRTDKEIRTGKHSSKAEYITGYKHHIAVDSKSGLIAKVTTTFANTSENATMEMFVAALKATEAYGDKAYASKEINKMLEEKKVINHICQKETKNMSDEARDAHRKQQKHISKIRAKVEHKFGVIKFQMRHKVSRYVGLLRNHIDFVFLALAANLKTLAHREQAIKRCKMA